MTAREGATDLARTRWPCEMTWEDRIQNYLRETGLKRSMFVMDDGTVVGSWRMGNNYTVASKYYGGYPAGYMKRVRSLFPDKRSVLHLFSGKVDLRMIPGDTVDLNDGLSPTYVDDAQTLLGVPLEKYDLVMADPPYSVEDCEHYGTSMVKRNLVMKALARLLPGAHVVWLDQVLPMYRKADFRTVFEVGMTKSTNHRFRQTIVFERMAPPPAQVRQAGTARRRRPDPGPDLFGPPEG